MCLLGSVTFKFTVRVCFYTFLNMEHMKNLLNMMLKVHYVTFRNRVANFLDFPLPTIVDLSLIINMVHYALVFLC